MEAINKEMVPVSKIMTTEVQTLSLMETLADAQRKFEKYRVRHLPVVDQSRLLGILSLTDLQRLSFGTRFGTSDLDVDDAILGMLSIEQVMMNKPRCVSPDDSLLDVAQILAREEFHALPVVQGDELCGIVTTTDVIRFLLDH